MSHTKPKFIGPVRAVCPICGTTAYSPGGIHPQCAVSQADAVSRVAIKKAYEHLGKIASARGGTNQGSLF